MNEIDWSKIYEKESGKLLAIVRRYVTNRETAEDILHESFIKAIKSTHTFKNSGSLSGWLKQIAIHSAIDHIQKNKNVFVDADEVQITEEIEPEINPNDIKNRLLNASFTREELLSIIDSLPENHKTIFNLYVIDGFSHKQIAAKLQISETYSKTTLSRSRKKIQHLLLNHLSRENEEPRKRKTITHRLALLFTGEHFTDAIFKSAFSTDFKVPPHLSTELSKGFQNAKPVYIKSTLHIIKTTVIAVAGTGVAATVTLGIINSEPIQTVKPTPTQTTISLQKKESVVEKPVEQVIIKSKTAQPDTKENVKSKNEIAILPEPPKMDSTITTTSEKQDTTATASKKKVVVKRKVYIKK